MIYLSLLLSLSFRSEAQDYQVVNRGSVGVEKPAFLSMGFDRPGVDSPSVFISSFDLAGTDHVFRLNNSKEVFEGAGARMQIVTDRVIWPNEVKFLAEGELGPAGYLVSSGFLMPTKSTGAVSFVYTTNGAVKELTNRKSGYFYHRAQIADVTGRGRQDIITARGKIPPLGETDGELVWLIRPKYPLRQTWPEVVLAKGPDIHFQVFNDPRSGELMVIAAEFSRARLELFWFESEGVVNRRTVDATLGHPFDLEFADLNCDGAPDLLVTNHESDEKASVYAFELPADLKTGKWVRHTLVSGIETRQKGIAQASPGRAKAFQPEPARPLAKPWVLVSGDGSQRAHLLRPVSSDPLNWVYSEDIVLDTQSTVGEPLISDFDGDGLSDFMIPAYDNDRVYLMSVKRDQALIR